MATGGSTAEEELYSFELFECSVCLESLINKQPRLLSCGHTFCTPCLQKLSGRNTVNCPKCRSTTQLPPGGMQDLPKNTDISKMMEREQELSARIEHYCQMCRKRDAKIEYICTSCSKRLICQECYKKHQRIPAFKAHNILPFEETLSVNETHEKCKDHGDLLEYFCSQCEEAICAACTCDPNHEEHCEQIVDFETGLKELKASMNKLCQEFKENAKKVEVCAAILKQDTDTIDECRIALSAKCQKVETILNQMKGQLKVITELYQPLRNSREEINTHFADVQKQMTEINNLQQDSDVNFIRKMKECRRNCHHVMNDTKVILNRKITIPENITHNIKIVGDVGQVKTKEVSLKQNVMAKTQPNEAQGEKPQIKAEAEQELRPRPRESDKYTELNSLELVSENKKPGETVVLGPEHLSEVISMEDGTVIPVIRGLNYLQRINTEGNVVRKYQVTLSQQVRYKSACVFGDYLFVATSDNVITKMSLDGSGYNTEYKPEGIGTINDISAIGDNVILISESGYPGRILQYNIQTNQVIERVGAIWQPGKVSVVQAGHHIKYIVKCLSSQMKWVVNIYNRHWNLTSTIDMYADALTVTPGGNLLLVHDKRILEYSQDGRWIGELLNKCKFNDIYDITYSSRFLWVFNGNPYCFKIFISTDLLLYKI